MTPHEFSDDDAEAIISGFATGEPELGAALDDLRSAFADVEPPTASGGLSEFIVRGADPAPVPAGAAAVPTIEPLVDPTPARRTPVFASLSAFAGTALGKICIGASVAAASVGGAAATGVDTPIDSWFDDDSAVVADSATATDIDHAEEIADIDDLVDDALAAVDRAGVDATDGDSVVINDDESIVIEDGDAPIDLGVVEDIVARMDARWAEFAALENPTKEQIDAFLADMNALVDELVDATSDLDFDFEHDFEFDFGDDVDLTDGLDPAEIDALLEKILADIDTDLDELLENLPSIDASTDPEELLEDAEDLVEELLDDAEDLLEDAEDQLEDAEDRAEDLLEDAEDQLEDAEDQLEDAEDQLEDAEDDLEDDEDDDEDDG